METLFKNQLQKTKFLLRVATIIAGISVVLNFSQAFLTIPLFNSYQEMKDSKLQNTIVKLIGVHMPEPITIPGESGKIHESYLKSIAIRVVNLHENWSWLNVKENYDEIIKYHASLRYENFLKGNLEQTGLISQIEKHRMIANFVVDREKTKASWCKELGAACVVVTGRRKVFTDGNKPLDDTDVAYFILSNAVMPNEQNLNALQIERLIVIDKGKNKYERAVALYEAALKGKLPER